MVEKYYLLVDQLTNYVPQYLKEDLCSAGYLLACELAQGWNGTEDEYCKMLLSEVPKVIKKEYIKFREEIILDDESYEIEDNVIFNVDFMRFYSTLDATEQEILRDLCNNSFETSNEYIKNKQEQLVSVKIRNFLER